MGRQTKLTASQHEEIRAAVRERAFVKQRIAEHEKEIASLRRRFRQLATKVLAKQLGVSQRTILLVLTDHPYRSVKPEPAGNAVQSVG